MAVLAALLSPAPAHATPESHAAVETITCNGRNTAVHTPPFTNQPSDVIIDVNIVFDLCVSTGEPHLESGTITGTYLLKDRSCLQLLERQAFTLTITWNTGDTTTYQGISNASVLGAVYTVTTTGVVVGGLFEGHTITTNYTGPSADILLCTAGLGAVSRLDMLGTLLIAPI